MKYIYAYTRESSPLSDMPWISEYKIDRILKERYKSHFQTFNCVTFPFVGTLYSFFCDIFKGGGGVHPLKFICDLSREFDPWGDEYYKVYMRDLIGKYIEFESSIYGRFHILSKVQTGRTVRLMTDERADVFEKSPTKEPIYCKDYSDDEDFSNSEIVHINHPTHHLDSLICIKGEGTVSPDRRFMFKMSDLHAIPDHAKDRLRLAEDYTIKFMNNFIC